MKKTFTFLITLFLLITLGSQATVIYTEMDLEATQTSTWNWFEWGPDADGFGLFVVPGSSMHIETYTGAVIGYDDGGNIYLSAVPNGTMIGASSDWLFPPAPSYVNDAEHTELNGTIFYAGFQLKSASEEIFYGWMQLSVAEDGLSFILIDMAYEDEAGVDLMVGTVDKQVVYGSEVFTEDLQLNNGTIMNEISIGLLGTSFAVTSGTMTENTHYTVENLPEGLTMEINVTDEVSGTVSLTGQAVSHEVADTVNNLTINFLDAAFDGDLAADIINSSNEDLFVKFFGPYELVYEDMEDEVCGFGGWVPFQNYYYENYFGIWHDGTDMRLETYGKDVVGTETAGMSYVTPLDMDTPIDGTSAWVASGVWPDESYLTSAGYSDWQGQDKYAGVKLELGDATMYGWIRLGVSSDAMEVTLYEWAFNSAPGEPINAGQTDNTGIVSFAINQLDVYPNPCTNQLTVSLTGQETATTLEVADLQGKTLISGKINSNNREKVTVDLSDLEQGIYILRLNDIGTVWTQKIIKK